MQTPTSSNWWEFLWRCRGYHLVVYSLHLVQLIGLQDVNTLNVTDSPIAQNASTANVMADSGGRVYVRLTENSLVNVSFDEVTWYILTMPYYRDWEVAAVVCRELGQGHPSYAGTAEKVRGVDEAGFTCWGDESFLSECYRLDENSTDYLLWPLSVGCLPRKAKDFDVALIKMYTSLDGGILLVHLDGQWGPICSESPSYSQRDLCGVVCRQLGYRRCGDSAFYLVHGIDVSSDPLLRAVECSSNVDRLRDCSYERLGVNDSCVFPEPSFLVVGCSNTDEYSYYNLPYDQDNYYEPDDDYRPSSSSSPLFAVIVVLIAAFMAVVFLICRKNGSTGDTEATSVPTVPPGRTPRRTIDREEPQQGETLLPSYDAVRNTSAFTPGYPTAPPIDGSTVYPPYVPEAAPPSAPGGCPPYDPSLAYPPPAAPNGALSGGAVTSGNRNVDEGNDDPELPTYEEAVGENVV